MYLLDVFLGCTLLEEGDPNEALRIFRETLKEHPEHMPSYVEIARTRRLSNDIRWLNQALQVEVSNFDRQPLGGELDSRDLIRSRIEVILEEFRAAGPSYASNVLRAIDYTQDEGLRFLLWETACSMVEGYVANETSISLRSSGQSYSVALGEASACLGAVIPERILTAGLSISEQDLQRAATERYPPAHDVLQHRQNLDKERNEARAYQALLLLAIAIKSEDSGQHLLREWVSSADDEMAIAARMGLVILGDEDALKELQLSARTREKRESLKSLQTAIEPATSAVQSYKLVTDGSMHCKTCGRPSEKVTHMMVSGAAVICNICISDCWQSRSEISSSDESLCQLCGRSHFEAEGLFSYRDVDICSHCVQFSLGTQERDNIEQYVERL